MAKAKRRRRRQGVVSWATSLISLAIGLSGVASAFKIGGLRGLAHQASFGTSEGGQFNLKQGAPIYVPMLAGVLFKKIAAELTKTARVQAIFPRLG